MASPTSRSLDLARSQGWTAGVVEKWNMHARIRQDLFGVIDIVALDDNQGVLAIQACAGSGASARLKKSLAEPRLKIWLERGSRFEVWAWAKRGPRGKAKRWSVRKVVVSVINDEMVTQET